ncbi:hypothetical protein A3F55_00115 [Candidatus Adlerbacteria bacterium RIFCSPHIGHO2_12_FULL_53_18]|uniref:Transcription regulator AsnC/Lrp ligand binding domain-containing protein n=1 Tax=Candidatus Adlerbacteria bacterium RIFCSPHIGHO2_12_FULL_53_18 TaxID=1797242 RepID=A0A1F4XTE1_9BACT|nr:MAG: hypothetical protein A3F55_00115 [Candidatus Adlerbacteria bacterium RIFCSPHIGHO2_12_FULL_53_18]
MLDIPRQLNPQMLALLRLLQAKGNSQLDKITAHELGMKPSNFSKMRREARERGLILDESAVLLNPEKLGFVLGFFEVKFKDIRLNQAAEALWTTWPEVQEVHVLLPHHTMLLKVRARSNEELQSIRMKLWDIEGLEEVSTHIAGLTVKETQKLPI